MTSTKPPTKNQKSPNLVVISSTPSSEKRRVPRLLVTHEQFRLESTGKIFSVADVSVDGMALRLLDIEDVESFPITSKHRGTLKFRGEKYPVEAQVRHIGKDLIGMRFEKISDSARGKIKELMDPEILGQELKPTPSPEGGPIWYHAPSGTDLLIYRGNDGQVSRFMLYLFGNLVQWDTLAGVLTGRAQATPGSGNVSDVRGFMRFETLLITHDEKPDTEKLDIAKGVILSSNLPEDMKTWCSRQLKVV